SQPVPASSTESASPKNAKGNKSPLASSPPTTTISPVTSDDSDSDEDRDALVSPREEKAFSEQTYSSPNPNDPLNPANRKKAVTTRRQLQKRRSTLKANQRRLRREGSEAKVSGEITPIRS